jgi:tRNA (mo5U34)-methyltransferase
MDEVDFRVASPQYELASSDVQTVLASVVERDIRAQFLRSAFRRLFLRDPSPKGLAELLDQMEEGKTFDAILQGWLRSPEFRVRCDEVIGTYVGQQLPLRPTNAAQPGELRRFQWFHSFDLGNGEIIKGRKPLERLRLEAQWIFSEPVQGKTVLDIGAWDGFFSFEAERRGAVDVLATDHFCWSGSGWGTKDGFDYIHGRVGSHVRSADIDVFDLDPESLGSFDVCLFLGVLYHLKNPLGGLEQVSRMTKEFAVIETEVTELTNPQPVVRYYLGSELNGDSTNFFVPNHVGLEAMLREVGFSRFKFTPSSHPPGTVRARTVVHAWKR